MIDRLQQTMGVCIFLMTGYRDEKGQLMKTWFVVVHSFFINAHLGSAGMSLNQGMGRSSPRLNLIGKVELMNCLAIIWRANSVSLLGLICRNLLLMASTSSWRGRWGCRQRRGRWNPSFGHWQEWLPNFAAYWSHESGQAESRDSPLPADDLS